MWTLGIYMNIRALINSIKWPVKETDCWIWNGKVRICNGKQQTVYGKEMAHRVVWKLFKGSIGERFLVRKCNEPLCVNPSHMNECASVARSVLHDTEVKVKALRSQGLSFSLIGLKLAITDTHARRLWKRKTSPKPTTARKRNAPINWDETIR